LFFFSSRRRHTRFSRDWSSDVCSSDLALGKRIAIVNLDAHFDLRESSVASSGTPFLQAIKHARAHGIALDYFCLGVSESANTRRDRKSVVEGKSCEYGCLRRMREIDSR